ncbi:MAG: sulfotransferase [Rhodospirillaceae bacterium]
MDDFTRTRDLALSSLNQGKLDQALGYCQRLTELKPTDPDGFFLMGMVQDAQSNVADALVAVQTALELGETAEYLAHYARILSRVKRMEAALKAASRAMALNPQDALTLDTIGCVFSRVGKHEAAIPIFETAVAQQPDHPQFRFNLASSRQFTGDFDTAEQDYEHIIKVAPSFVKAHMALSSLRTQTADSNHIERLEQILTATRDPRSALHLRYALAKECEDVGRDDEAFAHLKAANTAHKQALGYDIARDRAIFNGLIDAFTLDDVAENTGAAPEFGPTDEAIFIVGMPRSGTTLVDRIISSHPEVDSAGELQTFPVLLKMMSGTRSTVVLDPETIERAKAIDFKTLGQRYLFDSAAHRGDLPFFTDKLPLNFLNIGYIAKALPKAKIIALRRNPMDTLWSNFKHLFATEFSYYNYSYDVKDAANYIVMFNKLMDHWDAVLPGKIHHIHYENLVSGFELEVRRAIAHLDLKWADACLTFHENDAAVATPSSVQVRSPIYAGSVGKWKRFEKHLSEAAEIFGKNGLEYS